MKKTYLSYLLGATALGMVCSVPVQSKAADEVQVVASVQQSKTVNGKVLDSSGNPVIGAAVVEKGTTNGVVTDMDGNFQLRVKDGAVIVISYIGYATQELAAKPNMSVVLVEDNEILDEVVVLGYGAASRKQDLSASVGMVDNAEQLATRPVSSVQGMLQGQLAGVTISANGGSPDSTPDIVIRGQGSQNGDGVLWVVDGVPGAPITSMNDVESIVVLKDAASAAIYGATSGAGGVILVTTKKAKEGAPSISYDGVFGIRQATNLIEPLNAEEQVYLRQQSYANAGLSLPDGWNTTKNPWVGTTRTDWMDEIFRSAFYQRHNVSMNVGTENFKNRVSFFYNNDEGVLINTYKKNIGIRYNGEFTINKYVKITENFSWDNQSSRGTNTESGYSGSVISAVMMPASATVYNPLDGTFGGTTTEDPDYIAQYGSNYADAHGDAINPVRSLTADNAWLRKSDIWSTTSLEIGNIIQGLKFVSRFTYNLYTEHSKSFSPMRDEVGKPNLENKLSLYTARNAQWKTENTLTYDRTFADKHSVGALFSTTADHLANRNFQISGSGFASEEDYLQYIKYASSISAANALEGPDANVSLIGRLSYSYDDRYFVTGSWRRDYAGRLPKDNNYGDFFAATAAWKISNEAFFPKDGAIDLLKLRGSWGQVGNLGSISKNYKSGLLSSKYWTEQAVYGPANSLIYGNFVFYQNALNNNLTWETSEQWDLGIDLSMFKNRLDIALDYYNKRTFNLIQSQSMNWPNTIGLDAMLVNMGEVTNKGFEAQVSWKDQINKDWSYFITGNFAYNKNKIKDIGVKDSEGNPGVWTGDGSFVDIPYIYQSTQGGPLNSFYLIKTDGIFQSDAEAAAYVDKNGNRIQPNAVAGDLKFVDANGDGQISDADRQYMGNAVPETTFALTAGFTWKKLSVSAMFQGVGGAQAFYAAKYRLVNDAQGNFNRSKEILDAWSPTNTGSDIPRLTKSDANGNFNTASDWYLEDASYIRLKNLTINYDLTDVIRKLGHFNDRKSALSVYFSGENLFTITDYSGMDPECGGYDTAKYPVSRTLSLGVKLTY